VVKPTSSKLKRWLDNTHLKAFKIHSEHELIEAFHTYSDSAGTLIAQQWVEGGDDSLFACHCYFSVNSEPLVTFTSRKLRQWPPLVGEVCLAEAIINDRVREITVELFSGVNYRGVGYVEVKRDIDTGEYYIIEPNLRLSGRAGIAEANGVELLYTMYCDVTGMPLPENRTQNYVGRKWIYLRRDVQSTLHYIRGGDFSFKEWRRTVRGPKVDAMFSRDDPGPFFGDLARLARLGVKSQERRKRDYREIVTEIKSR
jgi:predicted ATP-grasp superfamily ATP-dependent carboligase